METFLNMTVIIPGNNFFYFLSQFVLFWKTEIQNFTKLYLEPFITGGTNTACICMCVSTLTPTHSTSTIPFSGTPRTLSGLVSRPQSCQASSPMTRECPSACRRSHVPGNIQYKCAVKHRGWLSTRYLKNRVFRAGTVITTITAGLTHNAV